MEWYEISDVNNIDTPALVVYKDHIEANIDALLSRVDSSDDLQPHVKTYKMPEIVHMLQGKGISKFKCATIAEAEMLGMTGVNKVLLAYQPIGPKIDRLIQIAKKFPKTTFSALIDNFSSANNISEKCVQNKIKLNVYIDLNVGMNRTGIIPDDSVSKLAEQCQNLAGVRVVGLHVYDGHIRNPYLDERKKRCDTAFSPVLPLKRQLESFLEYELEIIAGGTPTFPIHASRKEVIASPGTAVLWDYGYHNILPEQTYKFGALVITRVISKLPENKVCLDLGHKSIASENPFPRVHFLNYPTAFETGQSEEHLILQLEDSSAVEIGTVFYGVPIHVCPTVALYDHALVIENHSLIDEWKVIARDRKITI